MSATRIAVIGASGQVARALASAAYARGILATCAGRDDINISDECSIERVVQAAKPTVVINAAAYTAVDKAETDTNDARRINVEGPAHIAAVCDRLGVPMIHISTDYVFDGRKTSPYLEDDARNPLSVYGKTKSDGEDAVRAALSKHIIVRTAWVYSTYGSNFVKTMLRFGAERDVVRVISDQYGSPTSADDLASALLDMTQRLASDGGAAPWGSYHLAGSGQTTWHGLAAETFRLSALAGNKVPKLEAISTAEYPLPAVRPQYGVLDTRKIQAAFGIALPPWQQSLEACIRQLQSGN